MKYVLPVILIFIIGFIAFNAGKSSRVEKTVSEDNYVKINIAELYLILNDDKLTPMHGMDYVFRGRIYLDGGLKKSGYFGVLRVAMVCCAADTVAAGFRIPMEYLPAGIKNGSWVKVYGRAKRVGNDKEGETPLTDKTSKTMSGSPVTVSVRNDYIFLPDKIEETEQPEDGYMYKWSNKPPYNF